MWNTASLQVIIIYGRRRVGNNISDMCRDFLIYHDSSIDFPIGEIGQWWGIEKVKENGQVIQIARQIDVVIASNDKKRILCGECKFTNSKVSLDVLDDLIFECNLAFPHMKHEYVLFSLSGYQDNVIEQAKNQGIRCITLHDMYHFE